MRQTACGLASLLVGFLLLPGCQKAEAPKSQLSGKVQFKGKPVPAGYISFMPNSSTGNVGAVKVAQIRDGVYDTTQESEPGIPPGATTVRVAGFDGKKVKGFGQGKQIFNAYEMKITVPPGTTTLDFTVPPNAADHLKIEPTSDEP